jgi:hypothetical protein
MPRIPLFRSVIFSSLLLCVVSSSSADTLKITSSPPGATVELDGVTVGATPFEKRWAPALSSPKPASSPPTPTSPAAIPRFSPFFHPMFNCKPASSLLMPTSTSHSLRRTHRPKPTHFLISSSPTSPPSSRANPSSPSAIRESPSDSAESATATQLSETSTPATLAPVPSAPPAGYGQLTITSEPDAAEIYVDGKFHGNTPATLKLPAGSHAILLKSPGRPDFTRTLELPKSSKLNLKAVFDTSANP